MTHTRRFRPNIWLTLLTILLVALFVRLGYWQLARAEQKQQIVNRYQQRMAAPPVLLDGGNAQQMEAYQRVEFTGRADTAHQILLDNKVHQGRAGFEVLLPVRLSGSDSWVLVNRGWIPMGMHRELVTSLDIEPAIEHFSGMVKRPLGGEFKLGTGNIWGQQWPMLIQWLEIDEVAQHLGHALAPYEVLLAPEAAGGFVRDWHVVASSAQKSISYAVQWFSFALILLGLYLFLNYKKIPPGEV